jgi:predicted MFS family arabinose efflux permease
MSFTHTRGTPAAEIVARLPTGLAAALRRGLARARAAGVVRLDALLGGPARRHVIVVLTCVLALAVADQGALSVTAGAIQAEFGISKARFGVLGSVTTAVSAVATLPFGMYVDRVNRTRLLARTILVWAAAMVASGVATSFLFLLLARLFLGVVIAVAYPTVASLIGDYFPPGERGRIYGYVLSGELLGTGIGVALASVAASVFGTWRAAMLVLALPAFGVTWLVLRLREPARGGPSRMPPEQDTAHDTAQDAAQHDLARDAVRDGEVQPEDPLVLDHDPLDMRLPAAVRYILRVRTNAIVIVASALGYFFFAGLRLFGIQFTQDHYGLTRGAASSLVLVIGAAAVAGVLAGGRVADRLLRGGRISARIIVPAVTFLAAAVLFAPGIATTSLGIALALILPGAFLFAASNPPLDAARLDVMPHRLWGRAESVRSVCRGALEAAAPVTFGVVATVFGGPHHGLTLTFLVMLAPLFLICVILLVAVRTYPRNVATARASERRMRDESAPGTQQDG